jgi:hypothetical protein
MRINWYIEDDDRDGETHYADTEGEMPRVGDTVYFRDEKMQQTHGTVTRADHCVGKHDIPIANIEFPPGCDTPEARVTTPPAKAGGFWLQKDSQRSVRAQEC